MKKFMTLLTFIPSLAMANVCQDVSPLKEAYDNQKDWETVMIQEFKGSKPVMGFSDGKGQIVIDQIHGLFPVKAKFVTKPASVDRYFLKACKSPRRGYDYLSSNRIGEVGNSYSIEAIIFPEIQGASNDPYSTLELSELEVSVAYDRTSMVNKDSNPEALKERILKSLYDQLDVSAKNRGYKFELTNLDDFVCDLVQGKAKISVFRRMHSDNPVIEKKVDITKNDTFTLYADWANSTKRAKSHAESVFTMGARFAALTEQGEISDVTAKSAFKLAQKVIPKGQASVKFLDLKELTCVADQMATYTRGRLSHLMDSRLDLDRDSILDGGE